MARPLMSKMRPMNRKTLKALKGSISKWEAIIAGNAYDLGAENCPLCELFVEDFCYKCPVRESSGAPGCIYTPWHDWAKAQGARLVWRADTPRRKKLAQAELKFLQSLLPHTTGKA